MTVPPIPVRLGHRPTVGGLAVPWISLESDRGHHLGAVSDTRRITALKRILCQICGDPLWEDDRYVIVGREADRERGCVVEPGMHPECAAYSAKACPMLHGAMTHHRTTPFDVTHRACPDGDCRCRLVPADDNEARAGAPAEPYMQVWADIADYRLAHTPEGLALAWPARPLRVRPVLTGAHRAALNLLTQED